MKKLQILSLIFLFAFFIRPGYSQVTTNDFYDDTETFNLTGVKSILVTGEIENPGETDITRFPLRSLIVKEALADGDQNRFTGAYRYDGYSLYDILDQVILKKKNEAEFPPIIDMFVKVENDRGESVVLSWGEIYYPLHRHEIIIATKVARIVPSKTKDLWPLPEETRLVVGHDLLTERNISNPVKITVYSASLSYPIDREMYPLFSPSIKFYKGDKLLPGEMFTVPVTSCNLTYETIFYGRGRGIHSTTPFQGTMLKELLKQHYSVEPENLREGYFVVASVDGYRCVFSFSEIFNRNDQSEVLLIEGQREEDGGAFQLFPAADFFSDRAVKAVSEIRLMR